MKDKSGKDITFKEFMSRWKEGIENLTPQQKLGHEIRSSIITLLGYSFALIAVIMQRERIGLLSYGLILIFIGSIWSVLVKWFSLREQMKIFKNLDSDVKDLLNKKEDKDGD